MRDERLVIRMAPDAEGVAASAADLFIESAARSVDDHGEFRVCLSGGATPAAMYRLLASPPRVEQVAWHKVRVYFGDERCVAPDHPDSNYGLARRTLLDHVKHCPNCVYRIEAERDPQEAAKDYGRLLKDHFGPGWPRFDLLFLGMGADGHTASLFPHTAALQEEKHRCAANFVPKFDAWRVTLTYPVINAAARVAFAITGAEKADVLYDVLRGPSDPERLPSQGVRPTDGELLFLVDAAAGRRVGADADGVA